MDTANKSRYDDVLDTANKSRYDDVLDTANKSRYDERLDTANKSRYDETCFFRNFGMGKYSPFYSVYVLHSRPFRETSLLLDIFSLEHGRVSVLAKGVRTKKSQLKGLLQPFVPLLMSWYGNGELLNLHKVEFCKQPFYLENNRLISGLYLNELLIYLLHKHDAHERLFQLYEQALMALHGTQRLDNILRYFEYDLLDELGYAMPLHFDAEFQEPIADDSRYIYFPTRGLIKTEISASYKLNSFSGLHINRFVKHELATADDYLAAKCLMRMAINQVLNGKKIRSREMVI